MLGHHRFERRGAAVERALVDQRRFSEQRDERVISEHCLLGVAEAGQRLAPDERRTVGGSGRHQADDAVADRGHRLVLRDQAGGERSERMAGREIPQGSRAADKENGIEP